MANMLRSSPPSLKRQLATACGLLVSVTFISTHGLAREPDGTQEAKSYFDGLESRLAALQPCDVVIAVEQSIEADGVVVPTGDHLLRSKRSDKAKSVTHAVLLKHLSFQDGFSGRLDNWNSTAYIREIRDKQVVVRRVGSHVAKRDGASYDQAVRTERIPDLSKLGTTKFHDCLFSTSFSQESLSRLRALAKNVELKPVYQDGRDFVRVRYRVEDERALEFHDFFFDTELIELVKFEFRQTAVKTVPPELVYREKIEWKDHQVLGRVPYRIDTSELFFANLTARDGSKKSVEGTRRTDAKLDWRDLDMDSFGEVDATGITVGYLKAFLDRKESR